MRIFISWSGNTSKEVATLLRDWLPDVIQSAEPWMSATDIETGKRWNHEIQEKLENTNFGIICLTKNNITAPWVLFEAGALAKSISDTYLCPWLFNMEPSEIPSGPLTQFQSVSSNKQGTWNLVKSINSALKEKSLPDDKLERSFERCWPELESNLESIDVDFSEGPQRPPEDMIKETLELVRILSRIPVKYLPVDSTQPRDINVLSSIHDLGKHNDKFQQYAGRINRSKDEDESDDE